MTVAPFWTFELPPPEPARPPPPTEIERVEMPETSMTASMKAPEPPAPLVPEVSPPPPPPQTLHRTRVMPEGVFQVPLLRNSWTPFMVGGGGGDEGRFWRVRLPLASMATSWETLVVVAMVSSLTVPTTSSCAEGV